MADTNASVVLDRSTTSLVQRFISFESDTTKLPAMIFAIIVVGSLSLLHHLVLEPLLYGRLSHVPGPKVAGLSWYYLAFIDLGLCRNEKISEWHDKYGPVVRIRPNEVTLGNPKDYREIYDTKSKYDKTEFFKRFTIYGEDNLFSTVKYSDHQLKKRKIAAPYSKSNVVANAEGIVRERVGAFVKEMMTSPNGLVDFFVLFDCYAHDVMTRFLYGASHGSDAILDPADRPLVVNLKRAQIWSPLSVNFGWLHGSWISKLCLGEEYRRTLEADEDVRRAVEKKMKEHDDDGKKDEEYSLYRSMRQARTEGDHMSRNYMASEMYDHLEAGQQTTASTLTYICWRLSRHPEWQMRLQHEVRALETDDSGDVSLGDCETSPIMDAVIRETLRLHPAASGRQERVVPQGGRTFSGFYLPGGTTVIGPTLVLHHNASVFPDPHSWRPERWLEADDAQLKEMEFSFAPFGHGARICIGQNLARMEIRLLVSRIYRTFTTKLSETSTDEDMHQLGTLSSVPRGLRCELYVEEV